MPVIKQAKLLLAAMICVASINPGFAAGDKGSPDPFPPVKLDDIVVTVLPVSGAPGKSNQCLQDAMKAELQQRNVHVTGEPAPNVYTIQGEADITRKDEAWKHVVVRWTVASPVRPEVKRSIGADTELIASGLEKEICDKALSVIASDSGYSVLEAAGVILPEDVQAALREGRNEKIRSKIRSEARALFGAIWKETRPARCELDITWLRYPIPEEYAAKWLGVHIHTDLEFIGTGDYNFQDTVAPNDIFSGAFCGDTRYHEYLKETGPALIPSDSDGGRAGVHRKEYSFPVFNEDFTRAVLTVSQEFISPPSIESDISARLYVKDNGVWKMQDRDFFAGGH